MSDKINISIVGASGYAGGELIRILLGYPEVNIKQVTSRKFARLPITVAHPNLRGVTNLRFTKLEDLEKCDLLFIALPNGESQKHMLKFQKLADKIIDLGADFRLQNLPDYNQWYGEHKLPKLLGKFVYGIAELHREEIKKANYVACGGCEATCSILTLYPLFKNNLLDLDRTIIDAKIGSSATGAKPSLSTHHAERAGVLRSYKPTMHRHTAEVEQEMNLASGSKTQVHISATAVEMVRGILVTCQAFLNEELTQQELYQIYNETYKSEPFIRIINDKVSIFRFPEPKLLEGTNYCDIALEKDKRSNRVVVVGAIDNLVKGTAGQAVQAMNLVYGFDETAGLNFTGLHPI